MSGGVDSSVAALLLKKQGFDVVGVFMKNYSDTKNALTGECAWRDELKMARKVAAILEIPLHVIDYERQYKKFVVDKMFNDYARGLTPNPDILCNKIIKFPALFVEAKKRGVDLVATGHYARVRKRNKKFELLRGRDRDKDQTYFLYELTEENLSKLLFPVGNLVKQQTREIAKRERFPNWDKKGTSGVCFIGEMDMKKFLRKKIKEKPGNVLSVGEKIIGRHPGAMFFTIGERIGESRGVVIEPEARKEFSGKLYVAEKKGNSLIVVTKNHQSLSRRKIFLRNAHFINEKFNSRLRGRIRHLGELNAGRLQKQKGKFVFAFDKPQKGIAEGQSLVLYEGERVVGGGEMRFS